MTSPLLPGRRCPAETAVVTTSLNWLTTACPHFALHVEAADPDIIMRRLATSERTVTPSAGISRPFDNNPQLWVDLQGRNGDFNRPRQMLSL